MITFLLAVVWFAKLLLLYSVEPTTCSSGYFNFDGFPKTFVLVSVFQAIFLQQKGIHSEFGRIDSITQPPVINVYIKLGFPTAQSFALELKTPSSTRNHLQQVRNLQISWQISTKCPSSFHRLLSVGFLLSFFCAVTRSN